MANFPDMEQIGAEINSRLTILETNSANYLTKTTADASYLGVNAKAASASTADSATSATNATNATKATQDGDGNVISTTYLKKTEKAASATTADSATTANSATTAAAATKATQDASGNVITETYLTKSAAATTYLGISAKAASASTADSATKATQDGNGNVITSTYATQTTANAKISKSGDRGSLAGYETLTSTASAVTISDGSPDDQAVTGAVAVTVSNGTAGRVWTKTVGITNASATIALGASWYWKDGKVPTVAANSVLMLKWYGSFGVASLILTA